MKHLLAVALTLITLGTLTAQAVEPSPDADAKARMEGSQSEGAIKVEKRPAVSPEKLKEQDELHAGKTGRVSTTEPHLFGLHVSLGIPHPINYGLNYVHTSRLFSAEFSTGSFGATVSDVKAKIENMEIGLRYHPFAGSFFLGALFGTQKITGEKTATYAPYGSATAKVEVKSTYTTPHIGWMWGGGSTGFFSNFEIGVQLPSGVTTDTSSDAPAPAKLTPEYIQNEKDVRDQAEKIGKSAFPYIALLKIGYLF